MVERRSEEGRELKYHPVILASLRESTTILNREKLFDGDLLKNGSVRFAPESEIDELADEQYYSNNSLSQRLSQADANNDYFYPYKKRVISTNQAGGNTFLISREYFSPIAQLRENVDKHKTALSIGSILLFDELAIASVIDQIQPKKMQISEGLKCMYIDDAKDVLRTHSANDANIADIEKELDDLKSEKNIGVTLVGAIVRLEKDGIGIFERFRDIQELASCASIDSARDKYLNQMMKKYYWFRVPQDKGLDSNSFKKKYVEKQLDYKGVNIDLHAKDIKTQLVESHIAASLLEEDEKFIARTARQQAVENQRIRRVEFGRESSRLTSNFEEEDEILYKNARGPKKKRFDREE